MLSDRTIFDLVLLEATACGVPVITDLSGGNGEILKGYEGLIEADKRDINGTAELIVRELYGGRISGKENTKFLFTIEKMLMGYEKIYGERVQR